MKQGSLYEALFQIGALIFVVIVVHATYVTVIRPNADLIQEQQQLLQQQDENFVPERSVFIILRDFEQETCIILMLWAIAIISMKTQHTLREKSSGSDSYTVTRWSEYPARRLKELFKTCTGVILKGARVPVATSSSSRSPRFQSTENIQAVSSIVKDTCETEADRMETELTIVRYIAWAIPSIGFLGTVRGIGTALGQAYQAVSGDIVGVTQSLGVAFNSTFVALVVSILLMFLLHQLQLLQDRLVLDCQNYCDARLIRHMQVPERNERADFFKRNYYVC